MSLNYEWLSLINPNYKFSNSRPNYVMTPFCVYQVYQRLAETFIYAMGPTFNEVNISFLFEKQLTPKTNTHLCLFPSILLESSNQPIKVYWSLVNAITINIWLNSLLFLHLLALSTNASYFTSNTTTRVS